MTHSETYGTVSPCVIDLLKFRRLIVLVSLVQQWEHQKRRKEDLASCGAGREPRQRNRVAKRQVQRFKLPRNCSKLLFQPLGFPIWSISFQGPKRQACVFLVKARSATSDD